MAHISQEQVQRELIAEKGRALSQMKYWVKEISSGPFEAKAEIEGNELVMTVKHFSRVEGEKA